MSESRSGNTVCSCRPSLQKSSLPYSGSPSPQALHVNTLPLFYGAREILGWTPLRQKRPLSSPVRPGPPPRPSFSTPTSSSGEWAKSPVSLVHSAQIQTRLFPTSSAPYVSICVLPYPIAPMLFAKTSNTSSAAVKCFLPSLSTLIPTLGLNLVTKLLLDTIY